MPLTNSKTLKQIAIDACNNSHPMNDDIWADVAKAVAERCAQVVKALREEYLWTDEDVIRDGALARAETSIRSLINGGVTNE